MSTSIVFSFWTTTLDLAGMALDQVHLPYTRVDGTTPSKQRQLALESFVEDPRVRTILISLRCGSTGYVKRLHLLKYPTTDISRLNLTAANHVFLMEPQWNPMVEDQALDRVHRIGQTKEVTTVRYIVKNTLEEVREHQHLNLIPELEADIPTEYSSSAVEEEEFSRASIFSGQRSQ